MINSALKSDCDVYFLSVYFDIKIFSLILLIQEWQSVKNTDKNDRKVNAIMFTNLLKYSREILSGKK